MKNYNKKISTHDHHQSYSTHLVVLLLVVTSSLFEVEAYQNYTVGDSLGWYDVLENPKIDYQKWAATKKFNLGDFLIFNSDNNHSVIQTYNFTTYSLCDYEDALDNDTIEWSSTNPFSTTPIPVSVSVPLTKHGNTYFFSSDNDGEQCKNGQHFNINVTHGQGLPPSLRTPSSDDSPSPAISPQSASNDDDDDDNDDSVPDTLVPSNFDNPKDIGSSDDDENQASNSSSSSVSKFAIWNSYLSCGVVMLFTGGHLLVY